MSPPFPFPGFSLPPSGEGSGNPSDGVMYPSRVPVTLGRGRGWYRFSPGTILLRFRFSRGSGVLHGYSGILEGKTVLRVSAIPGFRYPGFPGSCLGFLGPGCPVTTGFRFPVRVFRDPRRGNRSCGFPLPWEGYHGFVPGKGRMKSSNCLYMIVSGFFILTYMGLLNKMILREMTGIFKLCLN